MSANPTVPRWSATRTRPRRFRPAEFPPPTASRLRALLARAHAERPFGPRDVREAARRTADVARALTLEAVVVRGGLDVGGAELDHVWTVVEGRVVDVSLPVASGAFVAALRSYVAGDLDDDELDRLAHGYTLEWRVVGSFPGGIGYVGVPVFGQAVAPS